MVHLPLHEGRGALVPVEVHDAGRRVLAEQPRVEVERGHALLAVEHRLSVLQIRPARREQDARVLRRIRVLEPAQDDAVRAGRRVELRHEVLQLGERLGRRDILRGEEILPVEEHVGVDERGERGDAAVRLGDAGPRARAEVVPVEVRAREGRVLEELVQRMVAARLPEPLLLDVERREERVDPARVRGHLDGELLPRLDLRKRLPFHLHAREGLELGDVLLEHLDEGVLGQHEEELLALEALPGEALGAGRGRDERTRGGGHGGGLEKGAAGEPVSRHGRHPLVEPHRVGNVAKDDAGAPARRQPSGVARSLRM